MKKNKFIKLSWVNSEMAEVWLCRSHTRNAYNQILVEELINTLMQLNRHKSIKICVIRGEGDDFCAGGDIKNMLAKVDLFTGPSKKLNANYKKYIQRLALTMPKLRYLTLAFVQGGAVGAGAGLALGCDLVIAAPSAYFKLPFFFLALVPADGSFWQVSQRIGLAGAWKLLLGGKKILADEAYAMKLIDFVWRENEIYPNLKKWNHQNFTSKDWHKIIFSLRATVNDSLPKHLDRMRKLQSKLQLLESHNQALRSISK